MICAFYFQKSNPLRKKKVQLKKKNLSEWNFDWKKQCIWTSLSLKTARVDFFRGWVRKETLGWEIRRETLGWETRRETLGWTTLPCYQVSNSTFLVSNGFEVKERMNKPAPRQLYPFVSKRPILLRKGWTRGELIDRHRNTSRERARRETWPRV